MCYHSLSEVRYTLSLLFAFGQIFGQITQAIYSSVPKSSRLVHPNLVTVKTRKSDAAGRGSLRSSRLTVQNRYLYAATYAPTYNKLYQIRAFTLYKNKLQYRCGYRKINPLLDNAKTTSQNNVCE